MMQTATRRYPTKALGLSLWSRRSSPQSSRAKSHLHLQDNSFISNRHRRFCTSVCNQVSELTRSIMASDPAVDKILAGKYPAKRHAENVAKYVRDAHPEITDGLIYLESTKSALLEDNDSEGGLFPLLHGNCCPRYIPLISIH